MAVPTDPILQLINLCVGASSKPCGSVMGGCRVYQGKGDPNKRHMRGSLVQTVSAILFESCPKIVS